MNSSKFCHLPERTETSSVCCCQHYRHRSHCRTHVTWRRLQRLMLELSLTTQKLLHDTGVHHIVSSLQLY